MFRFNPGKQAVIFPPNHPYKKAPEDVKKAVAKIYETSKDDFVPAKTVEEAKEWAKNNLGITDTSTIDLETRKDIYSRLSFLKTKYDSSLKYLDDFEKKDAYAGGTSMKISLNKKYFDNKISMIESLKSDVKSGWHPTGCNTIQSVIDHEFGHVLTRISIDFKEIDPVFRKEITKIKTRYSNKMMELQKQGIDLKTHPDFISDYARTDANEFVAESFAMALNSNNPSPYSKEVFDLINKKFKK